MLRRKELKSLSSKETVFSRQFRKVKEVVTWLHKNKMLVNSSELIT